MSINMEGVHVGFLRHFMGQKDTWQRNRTWISVVVARLIKEEGTQTLGMYVH